MARRTVVSSLHGALATRLEPHCGICRTTFADIRNRSSFGRHAGIAKRVRDASQAPSPTIPHPVAVEVDGAGRASTSSASTGSMRRSPATRSRTWSARADVHHVPAIGARAGPRPGGNRRRARRGARGVLVPRVSTAAQAHAAVKAARYPPRQASAASGRDAPPATATASSNISPRRTRKFVVAVQVETAEGLAKVDAIAATEGVDVVFVGPATCRCRSTPWACRRGKLAKAIETIITAALRQRQDRRHLLREARGCRRMGSEGRELLHPGQRTMFLGRSASRQEAPLRATA